MKKESDASKGSRRAQSRRRPCLMAYTLNNTQPVICTIVADQPYFYQQEECITEDDDILGLEEYADFEKDMADLKSKMAAYERLSKSYERDPARRLSDFADAAQQITQNAKAENTSLEYLESTLTQSRMSATLLDFAKDNNVVLEHSRQVQSVRYDRETGKILIHPDLASTQAVLLTVRELRRHWQYKKGVMIHPLTFHPDQAILINRAQMADLSIAMIRAAWEIQLSGDRSVWECIENSAMADLGRSFAREAFVDFRSISSGKASSAVFETWFLSERSRHQDKKLIQAMLADHQGYVFTDAEASRHVSIELIMALGEQPFGKNYLAPYAQMIIEDPVFTEVRDRSNANFLWFIKFERSFRETEQALQSEGGTILPDGSPLSTTPSQAKEHGPSIVVPLYGGEVIHKREGRTNGRILEESVPSHNVIHVRFGNGEAL